VKSAASIGENILKKKPENAEMAAPVVAKNQISAEAYGVSATAKPVSMAKADSIA
jgi:hypothetical protein